MRESMARVSAVGTGVLVLGLVAAFAALQQRDDRDPERAEVREWAPLSAAIQVPDTLVERGKRVYDELRCAACHSVAGQGNPRYPLDGVGSRLSREEIRLWIVDPQEIRPGVRKPAYDDLEPEEENALIAYMQSLKDPGS